MTPEEAIEELIAAATDYASGDGDGIDLSWCPYFRRGEEDCDPHGTCGYGCYDEPECQTGIPREGWPRTRMLAALEALGCAQ